MDQETQSEKISSMDDTTLALIRKIEDGDHDALAQLYDETGRLVFGLILRILGNRAQAEETLLETYTCVWKQAANFDAGTPPLQWLITLARSRTIAGLYEDKKNRRGRQYAPESSDSTATAAPELQAQARSVWQSLNPAQREILDWAYYGGLSCCEIAAQIMKPVGAVKTHARIGLSKLDERFHLRPETLLEATPATPEPHSDVRELAPFFAIGALSQQEARTFETHLQEGCGLCAQDFHKFSNAAAVIGLACEEAETPDYVRDLLLARIDREPHPHPPAPAENIEVKSAAAGVAQPMAKTVTRPQSPGMRMLPWMIAAACLLLGAFAFYSWKSLRAAQDGLKEETANAQSEIRALKQKLAAQQNREEGLAPVLAMAGRQGIRISRLKGQPATPADAGMLFWDSQKGQCLTVGTFTPLPPGKTYQLWFSTPSAKIYIGALNADAKGNIATMISDIPEIEAAMSAIITMESEQPAQAPSGPYCATGRIE